MYIYFLACEYEKNIVFALHYYRKQNCYFNLWQIIVYRCNNNRSYLSFFFNCNDLNEIPTSFIHFIFCFIFLFFRKLNFFVAKVSSVLFVQYGNCDYRKK